MIIAARRLRSKGPKVARGWAIWTTSLAARVYVLTFEAVIGAIAAVVLASTDFSLTATVHTALICALALGYAIAVDRLSILRRYLQLGSNSKVWTNQTSIWTFAAVLILPPGYALMVVLVVYAHILARGWRHKTIRTYRVVFAIFTTTLACLSAFVVDDLAHHAHLDGTLVGTTVTALQLLAYTGTSLAAAVTGIRLYGGVGTIRAALPPRRAIGIELATLVLGVIAAQILVLNPWWAFAIPVMAAVLHRSTLVHQLAVAAQTDAKTGLLNVATWRARAGEQLERARREHTCGAMLILDLDHFKQLNDAHGHLSGDLALRAAADTLQTTLRSYDLVGRFGGEEFVAFLPGSGRDHADAVAERLRRAVADKTAQLGTPVTASIGISCYPTHGRDLDTLIEAADTAMYAAKAAGRNRIRHAIPQPADVRETA